MAIKKSNAIIVDTNVLIHDPECSVTLCEGNNVIYIPTTVLKELDKLKNKIDIGPDVRDAIRWIEKEQLSGNKQVVLVRPPTDILISYLDMDNPDHQILATAYEIKTTQSKKFKDIKLVSRDTSVRVLGREMGLTVGDYFKDRVEEKDLNNTDLPKLNISFDRVFPDFTIDATPEELSVIPENGGAICFSDWDGISEHPICGNQEWQESFVVIRKGDILRVIHRDIEMFGLKPYTLNGDGPNWEQYLAIAQLMDPDIKLVFLKGGTGSGKTLLALAAAIEQRRLYRNIFITRPMIPLEDEDRMGFLPGDINDKMGPWVKPVWRALSFLAEDKSKNELISKLKESGKISVEPLDYIRGMTYIKDYLIIDESQNLTPHQVKTIITRAGDHSKLIFTGDLGQVDRKKRLNSKSNGLAYASVKMNNNPLVGVSTFKKTVRSKLAHLAEEKL